LSLVDESVSKRFLLIEQKETSNLLITKKIATLDFFVPSVGKNRRKERTSRQKASFFSVY
jgi:hypothetical protein